MTALDDRLTLEPEVIAYPGKQRTPVSQEALDSARREADALLPALLDAQLRRGEQGRKMEAARRTAARILRKWDEHPETDPTQ